MPLINCELSFPLTWFKDCAIAARACNEKFVGTGTDENPQFPEVNSLSKCTSQIKDAKFYVPVILYQLQMIINCQSN